MQLFRNDIIFPHCVSQCPIIVNNRQLSDFLLFIFTDIVLKLGRAYRWESCLKQQTAHADAMAGLPVPLPGLRRTAEFVWST